MALGRRSACCRSFTLIPPMLKATDSEQNAMPNDMANLGWRATENAGANAGRNQPATASFHETAGLATERALSTPLVAARMFCTRLAGASTSVRDFSQRRPSSASAYSGPHSEHAFA